MRAALLTGFDLAVCILTEREISQPGFPLHKWHDFNLCRRFCVNREVLMGSGEASIKGSPSAVVTSGSTEARESYTDSQTAIEVRGHTARYARYARRTARSTWCFQNIQ